MLPIVPAKFVAVPHDVAATKDLPTSRTQAYYVSATSALCSSPPSPQSAVATHPEHDRELLRAVSVWGVDVEVEAVLVAGTKPRKAQNKPYPKPHCVSVGRRRFEACLWYDYLPKEEGAQEVQLGANVW